MVTSTAERESVTRGREEIDGQSAYFAEDRIPRTALEKRPQLRLLAGLR